MTYLFSAFAYLSTYLPCFNGISQISSFILHEGINCVILLSHTIGKQHMYPLARDKRGYLGDTVKAGIPYIYTIIFQYKILQFLFQRFCEFTNYSYCPVNSQSQLRGVGYQLQKLHLLLIKVNMLAPMGMLHPTCFIQQINIDI